MLNLKNDWQPLWNKMARQWLKPHQYADFDNQCEELYEYLKSWPLDTVRACYFSYLRKKFRPRWGQEMPGSADFEEARDALAKPRDTTSPGDDPEKSESNIQSAAIRAEIATLPLDQQTSLRNRAIKLAKAAWPELWNISEGVDRRNIHQAECALFLDDCGRERPAWLKGVKPREKTETPKPLVKPIPEPEDHIIDRSKYDTFRANRDKIVEQIRKAAES